MAKTVLVVDDDPTQRRLVQAVLDREGYNVVHAENGGEAIDRMTKGGGADVVLLDMVMPGMSGMEALAEIRTAGVATPVIRTGMLDFAARAPSDLTMRIGALSPTRSSKEVRPET